MKLASRLAASPALCCLLLAGRALAGAPAAAMPDADRALALAAFEQVWTTVRDTHWQQPPAGLDWDAVRAELRPQAEAALDLAAAREIVELMLARLGQSHFQIIPAELYAGLADPHGADGGADGGAAADADSLHRRCGLEVRRLAEGVAVTQVEPGSPAAAAGVRAGWLVEAIADRPLAPLLADIDAEFPDPHEARAWAALAVQARLDGAAGDSVRVRFRDGDSAETARTIALLPYRGELFQVGFLPPIPVWFQADEPAPRVRRLRFNVFADPMRLMPAYAEAVGALPPGAGLVLDLRGNQGGIGAMGLGMAGWLVSEPGRSLGRLQLRDSTLDLVVNPRRDAFAGPVAVLVDELSMSCAEMVARGLQAMGRARVFGSRSAGLVLHAVVDRLPTGDGFQHAVAGFTDTTGRPLEGAGVAPDEAVSPARADLLAGRDSTLAAAVAWIERRLSAPAESTLAGPAPAAPAVPLSSAKGAR